MLAPARGFIAELSDRLGAALGRPVAARLYRLNRDLRFSKDKTPDNAPLPIGLAEAGPAIWRVGLAPGSLALGYGALAFARKVLERWRQAVSGPTGVALDDILVPLAAQGLRLSGPGLKRVPAPWPADHARAHLLRHKNFSVCEDRLPIESAQGADAAARIAAALGVFRPLRDWMSGRPLSRIPRRVRARTHLPALCGPVIG